MSLFVFLITLGAALRLTRLATTDSITQPFRDKLTHRYVLATQSHDDLARSLRTAQPTEQALDAPRVAKQLRRVTIRLKLVELFECPWCIGFWLSAPLAALALSPLSPAHVHASPASTWLFLWPAASFALSWLVGAVTTLLTTFEELNHHEL